MIDYLIDSTALWRLLRGAELTVAWTEGIDIGAIGSCAPMRTEFRRSARTLDEFDEMGAMFADLYPDVAVPKSAWRWIEDGQYRLAARGHHHALSVVDWLVCATTALSGAIVLHDDGDFAAAARILPNLRERNVHDVP